MNPTLWIHKENLLLNYRFLKSQTESEFVCPMLKANAYGVGDSFVASVLLEAGAKYFGVVKIEEAEKLRRFFPNQDFDILLFSPLAGDIDVYIENNITAVVGTQNCLSFLSQQAADKLKKLKVHLKFDLGMNRLGFSFSEANEVQRKMEQLHIEVQGVCGHLPNAGEIQEPAGKSAASVENLKKTAKTFGIGIEKVHALNSDGLLGKEGAKVGIRPGISLYGLSKSESLKPVLSLKAPLVAIRKIQKGSSVSYGGTWTAKEDSWIGVLPIGYADGLRRGLSNRISVVKDEQKFNQVGAICMDYCMIDLKTETFKVGDEFTFFDLNFIQITRWASLLGTLPYEIITGLGSRIERRLY